jgi:hypothetical protein
LVVLRAKNRVGAYQERAHALLCETHKGCLYFIFATCVEDQQFDPEPTRRHLSFRLRALGRGTGRIDEQSDRRCGGHKSIQKFKALCG